MTTENYTIVFVDKNDVDDSVFIHDSKNQTRYEIDVGQTPKDYVFTPDEAAASVQDFKFHITFDPPDPPGIGNCQQSGSNNHIFSSQKCFSLYI